MAPALAVHDFPAELLEDCSSALVIFAAAFGGRQDAAHIRDAGLRATCVDIDGDALRTMTLSGDYPDDWRFIAWDAFALVPFLGAERFDVVTLDPFRGGDMDRTLEALPEFCQLAEKAVICGTDDRPFRCPDGWQVHSKTKRGPGVFWTNLVPS